MITITECYHLSWCNMNNDAWLILLFVIQFGAIQIISDTLGGSTTCHKVFYFSKLFFNAFGSKEFCLTAKRGFKRSFLNDSHNNSKQIKLKYKWFEKEKWQTGVGAKKCQKSVTHYLNKPVSGRYGLNKNNKVTHA